MPLTPKHLLTLARERHMQPWNWTMHFAAAWLFALALLFHSYLTLATCFIFFGLGFFQLELPTKKNRWFTFVRSAIEWEKNWSAAPWNWRKWWRFILCVFIAAGSIHALWTRDLPILLAVIAFTYLWRVVLENKEAGIDP